MLTHHSNRIRIIERNRFRGHNHRFKFRMFIPIQNLRFIHNSMHVGHLILAAHRQLLFVGFFRTYRAGMVCAFVTNQLLHDATAKSEKTTSQQSVDSVGLTNTLVTVIKALEIYQSQTTVVSISTFASYHLLADACMHASMSHFTCRSVARLRAFVTW